MRFVPTFVERRAQTRASANNRDTAGTDRLTGTKVDFVEFSHDADFLDEVLRGPTCYTHQCKLKSSFALSGLKLNLNQNITSPVARVARFSLARLAFASQKKVASKTKMFTLHLDRHLVADPLHLYTSNGLRPQIIISARDMSNKAEKHMEENRLTNISKADSDERWASSGTHNFTNFDTDAPDVHFEVTCTVPVEIELFSELEKQAHKRGVKVETS